MPGGGRRNQFDNPFEQRGDLSHASIFVVAILVFVGVAGVLYYGNRLAIPANPTDALSANLPETVRRALPSVVADMVPAPEATPAAENATAGAAGVVPPASAVAPSQGVVVANGNGTAICRTPSLNDQLLTWPDGTGVELLGEERQAQGSKWLKVKDPRGNEGWMLAQYIQIIGQ